MTTTMNTLSFLAESFSEKQPSSTSICWLSSLLSIRNLMFKVHIYLLDVPQSPQSIESHICNIALVAHQKLLRINLYAGAVQHKYSLYAHRCFPTLSPHSPSIQLSQEGSDDTPPLDPADTIAANHAGQNTMAVIHRKLAVKNVRLCNCKSFLPP